VKPILQKTKGGPIHGVDALVLEKTLV